MTPMRTGLAFAATVGVFYVLCTVAWIVAPATFLGLMNNLFHGMDFNTMVRPQPFSFPGFLVALLVLSTWALLAGMFFSWLQHRFAR